MFNAVLIAALAGSAVAAPIAQRGQPTGWATGYLEDYDVYHTRYVALDCQSKHDTTFFDDCCHPLLASENLTDNRKSYCVPSSTESASAASYTATATATGSADAGAESEFATATASVESVYDSIVETATASVTTITLSTTSIAEATSTSAIGANEWAHNKVKSSSYSSSTEEWTATSTSTAAAQTSSASSGLSGSVNTGGYATYFYQGGNAGACGTVHSDSDYVIAIDANGWWPNYNSGTSQYCGRSINIKNTANGNTITAVVADVCPTCTNDNSLDLSVGAFSALVNGDMGQGMISIDWSFA